MMTRDEQAQSVLDCLQRTCLDEGFLVVEREGPVLAVRDAFGRMFDILVTPITEPIRIVA